MSSGPEVLQWFLEQHPLTFPVESALRLWELASGFVGLTKTSSTDEAIQLSLISSFTRLTQAYFQHLANPATARAFSSNRLNLLLHNLAVGQGHMLESLSKILDRRMEVSAKAQELLQEMLQDTAVQQAVMLEFAGGCKCLFELMERQGKRGTKSSSRSRSSNTSSNRKPSSGRAAGGGAAAPAAGMAYPSSLAELPVVPDHELVAAAAGKAAVVAAYAKVAGMQLKASRPFRALLECMKPSMVIMIEAAADDVRFHAVSAADLQLLLELVVLAGFALETEGEATEHVVGWLGPLTVLMKQMEPAERRVFVSARGDLLLQVLGVLCWAVEQQDWQQQAVHGGREEREVYLSVAFRPLVTCTDTRGHESQGERGPLTVIDETLLVHLCLSERVSALHMLLCNGIQYNLRPTFKRGCLSYLLLLIRFQRAPASAATLY